ncbi:Ig-like domain-containing protein [Streptomyces sp. NPDC001744]|uniref:L,D-transpeptidase n=1 Tax=Streptomyces sp. NPDC001744 TaxID=3364606 RepID=UPI0036A9C583
MNDTPRIRIVVSCALLAVAVTACTARNDRPLTPKAYDGAGPLTVSAPADGTKADPEKPLEITAKGDGDRIADVTALDAAGRHLAGELTADGRRWRSTASLAAGTRYTVRVATEDGEGAPGVRTFTFETTPAERALTADFGPEAGTYGVGQPITADLSLPVKDRASRAVVERALKVRSTPSVEGSWYWVDDKKLHFRPKEYWPAGARVTVSGNLDGLKIGDKLYGGASAPLKLTIGDRVEAIADAGSHHMTVKRNGEVINTIPVTTGKPGFSTRNGTKVVLGKEYYVRMRGTTVGISEGSSESYDLPVYYATRVTWSGEYVHAAPWSVGSQGVANVSHGCVGMSTGNAAWFFENVRPGDVVRTVNSDGDTMEPFGNGFGDWNLTWDKWRQGSALVETAGEPVVSTQKARLRPSL